MFICHCSPVIFNLCNLLLQRFNGAVPLSIEANGKTITTPAKY